MESANRDEAERCLRRAKSASDTEKARRWAEKSFRLFPTSECREFLDNLVSCHSQRGGEGRSEKAARGVDNAVDSDEYTADQEKAVKRILRYQDYYSILGVSRDVDEAGLKRQYHKLALQVHPDKNRAPKADEAFQAISKAYVTLSDPEKRRCYNQFGEDGLSQRAAQTSHQRFDANEVFHTFFEDSKAYHGSFMHTSYHPGHAFQPQHRANYHETSYPWRAVLIIGLLSALLFFCEVLFSPGSQPFSLHRTRIHTVLRVTKKNSLRYFVLDSFEKEYSTSQQVAAVEIEVRDEYLWQLRLQCSDDKLREPAGGAKVSKSCLKVKELLKNA